MYGVLYCSSLGRRNRSLINQFSLVTNKTTLRNEVSHVAILICLYGSKLITMARYSCLQGKVPHVAPEQPPGENTGVRSPDPLEAQIPTRFFIMCPVLTFPPSEACCQHVGQQASCLLFVCNSFIVPPPRICVGLCSPFKDAHQQRNRCNKLEEKETRPGTPSLGSKF